MNSCSQVIVIIYFVAAVHAKTFLVKTADDSKPMNVPAGDDSIIANVLNMKFWVVRGGR